MLKEMDKKIEGRRLFTVTNNPKASNQVKKTPRDTRMDQKLQNREKPSTYRNWHDCLAVIRARQGMARVINWQQVPACTTVRLELAPIKLALERWKFWEKKRSN